MSAAQSSMPANPLTTWARYGLIAFAWLFAAGGIVQIFLAGLAVFDPADGVTHWNDHVDFGRMIGFLAYLTWTRPGWRRCTPSTAFSWSGRPVALGERCSVWCVRRSVRPRAPRPNHPSTSESSRDARSRATRPGLNLG
jgi:hypothetical protein